MTIKSLNINYCKTIKPNEELPSLRYFDENVYICDSDSDAHTRHGYTLKYPTRLFVKNFPYHIELSKHL